MANRTVYRNVGAIGNSGQPPNAAGHVPNLMSSVSVDAAGAVYTANGWDESGADFKKWDAGGKPVYDAHYQLRNGSPNSLPYVVATDEKYLYCGAIAPWKDQQHLIWRFRLSDGAAEPFTAPDCPEGHLFIAKMPAQAVPAGTTPDAAARMSSPIRAIAVSGGDLLVADALSGSVRRFDRTTGAAKDAFAGVSLPQALAVSPVDGRVYVGYAHHHVGVFQPDGSSVSSLLADIGEVESLAFGPDGALYVADSAPSSESVKVYAISGNAATLRRTFGHPAAPRRHGSRPLFSTARRGGRS